jgi:DNA-directed RNA polymerase subunit RPC12/RpoP
VAYADHAALAYERAIAAFRAALEEAYELVKPRAVVVVNFAELAELLASKGVVVAAVRCPYCGGSVELPKEGETTKCPYCGTTLKAVDLYKTLKEIIRGL